MADTRLSVWILGDQLLARHPALALAIDIYGSFLLEHEATLWANPRLGRNVLDLCHLDAEERIPVRREVRRFRDASTYREVEIAGKRWERRAVAVVEADGSG
jgi:hypothetical protein